MPSRTLVFRLSHGAIHEVPIDAWVRFVDGRAPLPSERAGELRVIFMTLAIDADRPQFCHGIEGAIYAIDRHGFVQRSRMFPSISDDPLGDHSGRVVDARQRFVVKGARSRYRWVPDAHLCERLLERVLGTSGKGRLTPP
ncbi:MAG: hypothetical protein V3U43_07880 [Pseudomonadales bacterium]